jgi:hypothetical protein
MRDSSPAAAALLGVSSLDLGRRRVARPFFVDRSLDWDTQESETI